jgi:hypothetical protein
VSPRPAVYGDARQLAMFLTGIADVIEREHNETFDDPEVRNAADRLAGLLSRSSDPAPPPGPVSQA